MWIAGTFCLTYGDGLGDVDITELLRFHRSHGKLGTVTGVRPPGRFGELELKDGKVEAFAEKPQAIEGCINGGFFVFEPEFVDRYLEDRDDLTLESEPLQRLAADGELMVYRHDGFWQPMDTYREWKLLQDHVGHGPRALEGVGVSKEARTFWRGAAGTGDRLYRAAWELADKGPD